MAGQSSQDILQQTVDSFAQRVSDYADGIAGRLGQPLSGQQLSKDDVVARWNFSPLGSTDAADAQYHQLVAAGTPPGQALSQVYPMRQMLYQGADLKDAIANAQKIQGWAADAAGTDPPPKFEGSTLPLAMLQAQQRATPPLPVAGAPSGPMAPGPGVSLPVPPAGPAPLPPAPLGAPPMPVPGAVS